MPVSSREPVRRHRYSRQRANETEEGEVLAVWIGRFLQDKDSAEKIKTKTSVKTPLKPGEHILYKQYAAREVEGEENSWYWFAKRTCSAIFIKLEP